MSKIKIAPRNFCNQVILNTNLIICVEDRKTVDLYRLSESLLMHSVLSHAQYNVI